MRKQLSKSGLEILGRKAGPPRKPMLPVDEKEKQRLIDALLNKCQKNRYAVSMATTEAATASHGMLLFEYLAGHPFSKKIYII